MSVNEEHTLDLIRRDLQVMNKICDTFEGRVLKSTGDGLLMCFSSAVNAVECAIAIQQKMAEVMQTLPPSDTLMHRIGIHLADMYITSTDVMGNGVNIAARLQTEAEPGGICISKTVYDVAKHGLQLDTEYLGPRELKNIREVVPVYRILLDSNLPPDPYTETARFLEQSENVSRIRKLLLYVCKNHWENDESKLADLSLKGIIHELLGLASSYEQLKNLLSSAVGTLSKQSEYSLVANEILKAVAKFYPPEQTLQLWQGQLLSATSDTLTPASPPAETAPSLVEQIAQNVDQHLDALRLKKLLYYISRRQWESDLARLATVSTVQLLEEIYHLAIDAQQLKYLTNKFVQTLNKRTEYTLVANTLLDLLGTFYGKEPEVTSEDFPMALDLATTLNVTSSNGAKNRQQNTSSAQEQQQIYQMVGEQLNHDPHCLRIKKLMVYLCQAQWPQDSAWLAGIDSTTLVEELHRSVPSMEKLRQGLAGIVRSLSKPAEYTAIAQVLMQLMHPLYSGEISLNSSHQRQPAQPPEASPPPPNDQAVSAPPEVTVDQPKVSPDRDNPVTQERSTISLFDIRLGILKYTNPLKAKILAFSALHSDFSFSDQDWFNLKMYELDGLLKSLLRTCRNYTDLENLLYRTARRLEQPDDLVQTAETIIKYLRTYYIHGNPSLLATLSTTDETRISLDDFESATQQLANFAEDEQTLGLAPEPTQLREFHAPISNFDSSTSLLSTPEHDPLAGQ